MTTKRTSRWVWGLAALLLVVVGCQDEQQTVTKPKPIRPDPDIAQVPSKQLKPYYNQNPEWQDCGDEPGTVECARVMVPLDYQEPSGERIEIAVNRLPATGPEPDRIGSLVVHPGGPGISGLDFTEQAADTFDGPVRERFDIIGFDPRGVGESSPVRCLADEEKDEFLAETGAAEADGDVEEALELQERFTEGCVEHSENLLPHIGAEDVARDLDVMRSVLGDRQLSYFGYSYGSTVGLRYATMFPQKYRVLATDGPLGPDTDLLEQRTAQADGTRQALRSFVEDCVQQQENCPLQADDPDAAMDEITELWNEAASEPLHDADSDTEQGEQRPVDAAWVAAGLRFGLHSEESWPQLREALRDALEHRDGTGLMRLADAYVGRSPDGDWDNSLDASVAVTCADWPSVERDRAEQAGNGADAEAEQLGPFDHTVQWAWLECHDWPVDVPEREPMDLESVDEPVLVVGTREDPATPYDWARNLADRLPAGSLVTYDGGGHGAYQTVGSDCVDDAVDSYLINGELPDDAATDCPAVDEADEVDEADDEDN